MSPAIRFRNIASHTLVPEFLPQEPVVVDAGANVGEFSQAMTSEFRGHCYAIEPSPEIFEKIEEGEGVHKFMFALAGTPGAIDLHVGTNSVATTLHRAESGQYSTTVRVPARTLEEFCKTSKLDRIDVLKMDIEGEELAVLDSCSDVFLRGIGQITVEFHEWLGQGTVADVRKVIGRLRSLGFYDFNIGRTVYCDVLFVNRRYMSRADFTIAWLNLWIPRLVRAAFRKLRLGGKT